MRDLIRKLGQMMSVLVCAGVLLPVTANAEEMVVKMATLVPEGSSYFKVLQNMAADWEKITDGEVKVRLYPGGVVGDERDVVRKMRIGQFQAAALSSKGLHEIDESVYGLNYPMMVQSWEELDWLRSKVSDDIEAKFGDRGFELLFWADVGWVYFFSTQPILYPGDVKNLKLFTRATDFDDLQLWKLAGFNPVPLTTNDVLPGLQTGLIDVVQAPAFLALSQQWFGIAKHMLNVRWSALSGGLVITKKAWAQIPEQYRPRLRQAALDRSQHIQNEIRYTTDKAIDVMKDHGLIVHTPDEEGMEHWEEETIKYFPKFKDVLVPPQMHERMMNLWEKLQARRDSLNAE